MLALATGARPVGDVMVVTSKDLGSAALVEERKIGKDKHMIFVEGCKKAKAVSIILHGVSKQFLEEMERALDDALNVVLDVIRSGKVVPGGGAPEIVVAENLRQYASTLEGREQLAVRAFAECFIKIYTLDPGRELRFESSGTARGSESQGWSGHEELRADVITVSPQIC